MCSSDLNGKTCRDIYEKEPENRFLFSSDDETDIPKSLLNKSLQIHIFPEACNKQDNLQFNRPYGC